MKDKGISYVVALCLAFFGLASCITTDPTLGTGIVPSNQDISLHTVTLDLPVGMKMADSLQSSISKSATVGAIRSATFGLLHSDAAMSITAGTDSIVWGLNPSVRSISLSFSLDSALVLNASQRHIPQNFYIHQLKVPLDSTTIYNNSLSTDDYDPFLLTEGGLVYSGSESYTVSLKKEFGERFFSYPMATLDSAELFMKEFYGLYVRCDDPEEGMNGGRLNIFDLSSSRITLEFEYDDEEGNRKSSSAYFNLGDHYTVNVYTAGSRELEKADPADGLYMEGLCGIKPHIDARQLRKTVADWVASEGFPLEDLLIAKATFVFPFEYHGDRTEFDNFSSSLFPCRRKEANNQLIYSPIEEIQDGDLEVGKIDRSHLWYRSNLSFYLQDLIKEDPASITAKDDLWMMPIVSYTDSYGSTYYYADQYYYTQNILNGTAAERHPVIQLTYAVLK